MKLKEERLIFSNGQNVALQVLDRHSILKGDELIIDLIFFRFVLQPMDFNRVGNITVVGFHVLLLHFGDADVVNGHEGHSGLV